jgi:hypothetical protein
MTRGLLSIRRRVRSLPLSIMRFDSACGKERKVSSMSSEDGRQNSESSIASH